MKQFIRSFKITKILFTVAFVLMCGALFAQGGVSNPTTEVDPVTQLFNWIFGLVPQQYRSWIAAILTGLILLEQCLAASKRLKANSTLQLVGGLLSSVYKAITGKSKS